MALINNVAASRGNGLRNLTPGVYSICPPGYVGDFIIVSTTPELKEGGNWFGVILAYKDGSLHVPTGPLWNEKSFVRIADTFDITIPGKSG